MVKLQSFNIDVQNGMASFFFQSTDANGGKTPFAQVNIPVEILDNTTTRALRQEGAAAAEDFLLQVIDEIKKVK